MVTATIDSIKRHLEEERARLRREIGDLAAELPEYDGSPTESRYGDHPADEGTDIFEEEKALALQAHLAGMLSEVEQALRRIEQGTYGRCEQCGREIALGRLVAIPYARLCVECQARSEARH